MVANEVKKDLIVTLADANFINQAKQLFASVYFKAGWTGDYLLLAADVPAADLAWFREKGILIFECSLLSDVPVGDLAHAPVVLSKFYLFQEYFKQWRKVIFLDADIIVQSSVNGLLEYEGFSAAPAITLKLQDEFVNRQKLSLEFKKEHNLRGPAFSTGVFVFDTNLIKSNTFEELLTWYQKFKNIIRFNEESILNLYFYQQWQVLPIIYNATPWYLESVYGLNTNKFTAVIIHFNCYAIKPWQPENYYYQEWSDNLAAAEKIDLSRLVQASSSWSPEYLKRYLRFLKFKKIICALKLDRLIGRVGLLIKKLAPQLYQRINFRKNDFTR